MTEKTKNNERVFIIHGWDGSPDECWFPWLKNELEKRGLKAFVSSMPDADRPAIEPWIAHIAQEVDKPDENTHFVGHSIGCQAVLRYIENLPDGVRVGNVVLVAGWIHRLDGDLSEDELAIARPWLETPINLAKVKAKCAKITAIFSDNDIWVRLTEENRRIFTEQLGAKIILEHGKGHFNDESGVKELPSALQELVEK